jgi:hypothetical protein
VRISCRVDWMGGRTITARGTVVAGCRRSSPVDHKRCALHWKRGKRCLPYYDSRSVGLAVRAAVGKFAGCALGKRAARSVRSEKR